MAIPSQIQPLDSFDEGSRKRALKRRIGDMSRFMWIVLLVIAVLGAAGTITLVFAHEGQSCCCPRGAAAGPLLVE